MSWLYKTTRFIFKSKARFIMIQPVSAPFVHHWNTAKFNERILSIILLLVIVWATCIHGFNVLLICLFGFLGATIAWLIRKYLFKTTGTPLEYMIPGLLLVLIFPITIPLFIPFITMFFTYFIFFIVFGGKENNYLNIPAFGALFAYMAWPGYFTYFFNNTEKLVDGITKASSISILKSYATNHAIQKSSFILLQEAGVSISSIDKSITDFLNTVFFNEFNSSLPYGFFDFLFGFKSITIIESGIFILFIGLIILFAISYYKYITAFTAAFIYLLLVWIFGIGLNNEELFHGDILFSMVNFGTMIALFYYNVFPENNCVKKISQIILGIITGFFSYICLRFIKSTEGMFLVLCSINILVIFAKNFQITTTSEQRTMSNE